MDMDAAGNLYVADYSNRRIREFTSAGANIGNFRNRHTQCRNV